MDKYQRGRLFVNGFSDYCAVVYDGAVKASAADHLSANQTVGFAQKQHPALFMVKVSYQRLHYFENLLRRRQGSSGVHSCFQRCSASEFECSSNCDSLARPDPIYRTQAVNAHFSNPGQASVSALKKFTCHVNDILPVSPGPQQNSQQFYIAQCSSAFGKHPFARHFIRAHFFQSHIFRVLVTMQKYAW